MINIKKGLDVPIAGQPAQQIVDGVAVSCVALVGADYVGLKPTMAVQTGDRVKKGQLLFSDKKTPGVRYTSPGGGTVVQINRGAKRVFKTLVIEIDEQEEALSFEQFSSEQLTHLSREQITQVLVESGEWAAFRTLPTAGTLL